MQRPAHTNNAARYAQACTVGGWAQCLKQLKQITRLFGVGLNAALWSTLTGPPIIQHTVHYCPLPATPWLWHNNLLPVQQQDTMMLVPEGKEMPWVQLHSDLHAVHYPISPILPRAPGSWVRLIALCVASRWVRPPPLPVTHKKRSAPHLSSHSGP
jgi:hypothetical protein